MPRIIVSPDAVLGDAVTGKDPDELHHLINVLRVKIGDRLECFDGSGHRYAGPIVQRARHALVMEIRERATEPPRALTVTLAQSLISPERFEWVIQKSTELGVDRILPLLTQRTTVRRLSREQAERKLTRWRRIATEAATQCGRATLPTIGLPQPLRAAVGSLDAQAHVLMPTLVTAAPSLKEELKTRSGLKAAVVLIGPEGDFTPEEVALARQHGARPVCLGGLTLRSETAAIATLAILQHLLP